MFAARRQILSRPRNVLPNSCSCLPRLFRNPIIIPGSRRTIQTIYDGPKESFASKFNMRQTGNRRWRTAGLVLGGVLLTVWMYVLIQDVEELEMQKEVLLLLYSVQRADSRYSSVDFDDPASLLTHFRRLFESIRTEEKPTLDEILKRAEAVDPEETARIIRDACQRVHETLETGSLAESLLMAAEVVVFLNSALFKLGTMSDRFGAEGDGGDEEKTKEEDVSVEEKLEDPSKGSDGSTGYTLVG